MQAALPASRGRAMTRSPGALRLFTVPPGLPTARLELCGCIFSAWEPRNPRSSCPRGQRRLSAGREGLTSGRPLSSAHRCPSVSSQGLPSAGFKILISTSHEDARHIGLVSTLLGFPGGARGKESACRRRRHEETQVGSLGQDLNGPEPSPPPQASILFLPHEPHLL